MTTERKIEIATAVMNDPRLGKKGYHMLHGTYIYGICRCLSDIDIDLELIYGDIISFAKSVNIDICDVYWFATNGDEARTDRIEFLKKYIEHLKEQENE